MIILDELLAKVEEKRSHMLIFSQMSRIPEIWENQFLFWKYHSHIPLLIVD
jgi:hypothetical protein